MNIVCLNVLRLIQVFVIELQQGIQKKIRSKFFFILVLKDINSKKNIREIIGATHEWQFAMMLDNVVFNRRNCYSVKLFVQFLKTLRKA